MSRTKHAVKPVYKNQEQVMITAEVTLTNFKYISFRGMTHPECLNKTIRRTGSMIRPFNNYTSPKRNSQLIIPRVEITKTNNTNNYDSFD